MEMYGIDLLYEMSFGCKELLITGNSIERLPDTREDILLKFHEILRTYKAFRCVGYKPTKTIHIGVEMYQETDESSIPIKEIYYEKLTGMSNREIDWEKIDENFNLVADYVLEKKRILNYLKGSRTQEDIEKEILKIEEIRLS